MNKAILQELNTIAEEEILIHKADQLKSINTKFAVEIADQILLDFISNFFLKEISNEVHSDYASVMELNKKLEQEKKELNVELAKGCYSELFDSFLNSSLAELATKSVAELKAKQEEENLMYKVKSSLMEEIGLDFGAMENFSDLSDLEWVPWKQPEELVVDILNEYYSISPSAYNAIVPNIEDLMQEVTKNMDTCWYWGLKGTLILGLLVYSVDCYNKSGRKLIIHHISSLYWNSFSDILESATKYLWCIDDCDEIRINIFKDIHSDLTPEIKKIFTKLNYKWKAKTQSQIRDKEIIVLGKTRKGKNSFNAFIPFKLKSSVVITTSEVSKTNTNTCVEMETIGNRFNLLYCVLGLFGNMEGMSLKITDVCKTKLQGVLNSLLHQMDETQSFSFPYMSLANSSENLPDFLSINNLSVPSVSEKSSASVLELVFRWVSCTYLIQNFNGQNYRFIRFKSSNIIKQGKDIQVFYVPTELPHIKAFFISSTDIRSLVSNDINNNQLDLFSTTERLMHQGPDENIQEIWIPCFRKTAKWQVPWIEGYEVLSQKKNKDSVFVDKCYEEVKIDISSSESPGGLLIINNKYGPVLIHDFIFGIVHQLSDKILDIPLFSCLVTQDDWIKS
jgi:hypothetical protein